MKKILTVSWLILAGFLLTKTQIARAHMETGNTTATTEIQTQEETKTDDIMEQMMNRHMGQRKEGSMMGYNNGMISGFGLLGGLTWVAIIVFLLAGAYFFIKQAQKK